MELPAPGGCALGAEPATSAVIHPRRTQQGSALVNYQTETACPPCGRGQPVAETTGPIWKRDTEYSTSKKRWQYAYAISFRIFSTSCWPIVGPFSARRIFAADCFANDLARARALSSLFTFLFPIGIVYILKPNHHTRWLGLCQLSEVTVEEVSVLYVQRKHMEQRRGCSGFRWT